MYTSTCIHSHHTARMSQSVCICLSSVFIIYTTKLGPCLFNVNVMPSTNMKIQLLIYLHIYILPLIGSVQNIQGWLVKE